MSRAHPKTQKPRDDPSAYNRGKAYFFLKSGIKVGHAGDEDRWEEERLNADMEAYSEERRPRFRERRRRSRERSPRRVYEETNTSVERESEGPRKRQRRDEMSPSRRRHYVIHPSPPPPERCMSLNRAPYIRKTLCKLIEKSIKQTNINELLDLVGLNETIGKGYGMGDHRDWETATHNHNEHVSRYHQLKSSKPEIAHTRDFKQGRYSRERETHSKRRLSRTHYSRRRFENAPDAGRRSRSITATCTSSDNEDRQNEGRPVPLMHVRTSISPSSLTLTRKNPQNYQRKPTRRRESMSPERNSRRMTSSHSQPCSFEYSHGSKPNKSHKKTQQNFASERKSSSRLSNERPNRTAAATSNTESPPYQPVVTKKKENAGERHGDTDVGSCDNTNALSRAPSTEQTAQFLPQVSPTNKVTSDPAQFASVTSSITPADMYQQVKQTNVEIVRNEVRLVSLNKHPPECSSTVNNRSADNTKTSLGQLQTMESAHASFNNGILAVSPYSLVNTYAAYLQQISAGGLPPFNDPIFAALVYQNHLLQNKLMEANDKSKSKPSDPATVKIFNVNMTDMETKDEKVYSLGLNQHEHNHLVAGYESQNAMFNNLNHLAKYAYGNDAAATVFDSPQSPDQPFGMNTVSLKIEPDATKRYKKEAQVVIPTVRKTSPKVDPETSEVIINRSSFKEKDDVESETKANNNIRQTANKQQNRTSPEIKNGYKQSPHPSFQQHNYGTFRQQAFAHKKRHISSESSEKVNAYFRDEQGRKSIFENVNDTKVNKSPVHNFFVPTVPQETGGENNEESLDHILDPRLRKREQERRQKLKKEAEKLAKTEALYGHHNSNINNVIVKTEKWSPPGNTLEPLPSPRELIESLEEVEKSVERFVLPQKPKKKYEFSATYVRKPIELPRIPLTVPISQLACNYPISTKITGGLKLIVDVLETDDEALELKEQEFAAQHHEGCWYTKHEGSMECKKHREKWSLRKRLFEECRKIFGEKKTILKILDEEIMRSARDGGVPNDVEILKNILRKHGNRCIAEA